MKVFNKEITEEQAKRLLICKHFYYIHGDPLTYYPGYSFEKEFERLFDKKKDVFNAEELNAKDVELAICEIVNKKNAKGCFYANSILQGSTFPINKLKSVVLESRDWLAKFAYAITFECNKVALQKIANEIARYSEPYYNLTFLLNAKGEYNKSENIQNIMCKGSNLQKLLLAKYVPGINVDKVRNIILKSDYANANYLFAEYINSVLTGKCSDKKYNANEVNYIQDAYAEVSKKTKQKMIMQHVDKILEASIPEYCYKLAASKMLDNNPYIDKEKYYKNLEQKVLDSKNVEYITKYALDIPNADKREQVKRIVEVGTQEDVEYLEQSLAFSEFFRQVG